MNKPTITKELMYCVCGFSTNSGNKMAAHLARSGCRTAYPSAEEASRARVDRVDTDNQEAAVSKDKTDGRQSSEEQGPMETEGSKDGDDKVNDEVTEETNMVEESNGPEKDPSLEKEAKQQPESPEKESQEEEKSKVEDEQAPATQVGSSEKESKAKEKSNDDSEQAPAAGGILFGTFFNYMNQKEEDSGKSEENNEDKQ